MLFPSRFYIILFIVAALLTRNTHATEVSDTISDILTTKGGVLVKNGNQTSCELGVIDSTAAFVAAPCLDFLGSEVDNTTKYEVYLDTGIDGNSAKYTVSSITVHPEYNATINLNPIAILQFNANSTETWSNQIAINRNDSWGDVLFIRRGLLAMDLIRWDAPLTVTNGYSDATECKADTRVFEANQNDLLCTNATSYPPYTYLTGCAIPYGSVDAYISGNLYVAGIFAYTSISVSNYECTLRDNQDSIYILFADYIAFANTVLGRSINYYPNSNNISPQSDPEYSMKAPDYLLTMMTVKDGNFYASQTSSLPAESNPSTSEYVTPTLSSSTSSATYYTTTDATYHTTADATHKPNNIASTSTNEVSSDLGDALDDGQNMLSRNIAIIGVVCGIIGGIVLTFIIWLLCRRWKKAYTNVYKDKEARVDMQEMLVVDTGCVSIPPSIYIPHTPLFTPSSLGSSPFTQTPDSSFGRYMFEDTDYSLPPPYDASSPSSAQIDKNNHFP